jgi:hypothetical protein
MQAENCLPFPIFSAKPGPPLELPLVDGPAADPPSAEVEVPAPLVPRLATEGDAEPPQPAASITTAATESARTAMSA